MIDKAIELLRREYLGWCHEDDMRGDHLWYGCDRCENIDGEQHGAPDDPFAIVHVDECENGEIAAYLAAPDVQAQKAALADEVASVVRQGGTITVGQVLEAEDWLARYDAIAQQQEAQP